eukprot:06113.XXX_328711_328893_1 [CDS] Oithona nana genome sequencing.
MSATSAMSALISLILFKFPLIRLSLKTTRCLTLARAMPFCLIPCLTAARLHCCFNLAISSP